MALRVGYVGPRTEVTAGRRDWLRFTPWLGLVASGVPMSVAGLWPAGVRLTTNLELVRTRGI